MSLSAQTRILISPADGSSPVEGTVGALLRHHRRTNPAALAALEQAMVQDGRIPADPVDVRDLSVERHIDQLRLADLEHLEAGATITTLTA